MQSIFGDLARLQAPEATQALIRCLGSGAQATERALAAALPVLVIALARNAASAEGARSLLAALDRDHDGSILDDLPGALAGVPSGSGDGIVRHILGLRRGAVEVQISRQAGLDAGSVGRLLATIAPVVMGALGRARRRGGWTAPYLARGLGVECARAEEAVPGSVGLLEEFLEADAERETGDDVTQIGARVLHRLRQG